MVNIPRRFYLTVYVGRIKIFLYFSGPTQRPKLNLKPRSVPKEEDKSSAPSATSGRSASIFGGAKPVDTAAKEREVEERLKKEQERLQRQLEEDKGRGPERKPRERYIKHLIKNFIT